MRISFYSGRNPLALPMQEESAPLLRILHFSGEAEATGKGWAKAKLSSNFPNKMVKAQKCDKAELIQSG